MSALYPYPRFSIAERDRRWAAVRTLMRAQDLDVIEMRENMVFICKPSALSAEGAYICQWGETVVVTKNGGRRLGTRPHELLVSK